jgi:hypothetical protein
VKLSLKRISLFLFLGTLTAVILVVMAAHFHDVRLKRSFHQIVKGMSKEQVLSSMGEPISIGKCGELGRAVVPNGCHEEYDYKPLFDIATFAVFIDSKGRVVGKWDYASP